MEETLQCIWNMPASSEDVIFPKLWGIFVMAYYKQSNNPISDCFIIYLSRYCFIFPFNLFLFSISILDYALIWVWSTIYNLFFSTKKLLLFRKKSWCKACTYTVTRFYVLHSCYNVNCNVFLCFSFFFHCCTNIHTLHLFRLRRVVGICLLTANRNWLNLHI